MAQGQTSFSTARIKQIHHSATYFVPDHLTSVWSLHGFAIFKARLESPLRHGVNGFSLECLFRSALESLSVGITVAVNNWMVPRPELRLLDMKIGECAVSLDGETDQDLALDGFVFSHGRVSRGNALNGHGLRGLWDRHLSSGSNGRLRGGWIGACGQCGQ